MYIINIDNIEIPEEHIVKYPEIAEKVYYEIGINSLLAQTINFEILNYENAYSYQKENSLFYAANYYNKHITIYDTEIEMIVFDGRIREIEIIDNLYIKITAANYVKDIVDCQVTYISTSETTPAQHIYTILTEQVGMDAIHINKTSFDYVIAMQASYGIYCDVKVTIEDNINALKLIEELLKIGCCELYYYNNILSITMYEPYSGQKGLILGEDIISNVRIYANTTIYNQYNIAYKSGTSVLYQETDYPDVQVIENSIGKYGRRYFIVPEEKIQDVTVNTMPVLLQTATAAKAIGNIIITRYRSGIHYIEFEVDYKYRNILNMNDIIIINYKDINNEPARIVGIYLKNNVKMIKIICEFCNIPNRDYYIDKTQPTDITIVSVLQINYNTAILLFSKSVKDVVWYELHFSTNNIDYDIDYIANGGSPLKIMPTQCIEYPNEMYGYLLHGFEHIKYYFKMRAMNTNMIYSNFSDVKKKTFIKDYNAYNELVYTDYDGFKLKIDTSKKIGEMSQEDYGRIADIYKTIYGNYDYSYYNTINYAPTIKADINIYRDDDIEYILLMIRLSKGRKLIVYDQTDNKIYIYNKITNVLYTIQNQKRLLFYFDGYGWSSYDDYILIL